MSPSANRSVSNYFLRLGIFPCAIIAAVSLASCQTSTSSSGRGSKTEAGTTAGLTPGAKLFSRRNLEGKAFTVDGSSTTAQAIVLDGESRRPLFTDQNLIVFAKRRSEFDRWQVFEADLLKETERRVSFDAGNAEPVTKIDSRLVIATSSEILKSSDRVLSEYKLRFKSKEAKNRSEASESKPTTAQHLLIEQPASARQGTEWIQMSREPAEFWKLSFDRTSKNGVALLFSDVSPETASSGTAASVFRISIGSPGKSGGRNETRTWQPLRMKIPASVVDGHILPDGQRIIWSDGTGLWSTTLQGSDPQRVGDQSLPPARQLTVDPSGRWIVFSTPSESRGFNLMAVHVNGKCSRTLTELPGDEVEPSFSIDGTMILFTHRQNGSSVIAKVPFGSSQAISAQNLSGPCAG